MDEVLEVFPDLSLLINSASVFDRVKTGQCGYDGLLKYFRINFFSPFLLSETYFGKCSGGHVINILDTKINENSPDYGPYLLSKKALADYTRMCALNYAPDFRVNGIAPGYILPPVLDGSPSVSDEGEKRIIPLQKKGSPEIIADTMIFLLNNDYITGNIIYADGGQSVKNG